MTTFGILHAPSSQLLIGGCYCCVFQTINSHVTKWGKESLRQRDLSLECCSNEILVIYSQVGIRYCFFRIVGWVGNLTFQPWGISYEGLINPQETVDKAAFQLIFPERHSQTLHSITLKLYNCLIWCLYGPVLCGLMSFTKLWRLHVPPIPALLALQLALLMVLVINFNRLFLNCVHPSVDACLASP